MASETDLELLDASDPVVSEGETVTKAGTSGLRSLGLAVVGLAVLGLFATALTRTSPEPAPEDEVEPVDQPVTTAEVDRGPDTLPTTTGPQPEIELLPVEGSIGLWLFVGGDGPLQRIDLDDGSVTTFGLRAHPILASSTQLMLAIDSSSAVGWVGLDDPGQQGDGWGQADVAYGSTPDTVWVRRHKTGDEWLNFDLETNLIAARRPVIENPRRLTDLEGRGKVIVPGPELVATANGIFLTTEESSERIGSGRLLTFDPGRALIQVCVETLESCSVEWRSADGWELLDLPLPATSDVLYAEILGGGTWLLSVDRPTGVIELLPLSGGQATVTLPAADSLPSISSDGRWMARVDPDTGTIRVSNLETERLVTTIGGSSIEPGSSVLLVDKPSASE